MVQHLGPVHPFARLEYAEVVAEAVGFQHASDKSVQLDAPSFELANRGWQS